MSLSDSAAAVVQFLAQRLPWVWFAVAVICTIIEAATFALTTVWFAAGALVMALLSFFPIPFVWQLLIFLVISGALLAFTRPVAVKKLKVGHARTNAESLIGGKGLVVKDITEFESGEVKVSGAIWNARASGGEAILAGAECTVEKIEGATLYVSAREKDAGGAS